jgi:radical SAM superfamily enzyme YgiQ (UPF0313 family)
MKDDLNAVAPIGLAYVASAAEAAGHRVRLVDLCFRNDIREALVREISSFSPEIVGLSVRNLDNANMLYPVSYTEQTEQAVGQIRELTTAPLVLGGPGATVAPESLTKRLGADYVVVSHGERTFVELVTCIENGISPDRIPGVGTTVDGQFHLTPAKERGFPAEFPKLGNYVDMRPYENVGSSYGVQTKRGCRHRCTYCTYSQVIEGNPVRMRPPREVVDEIEEIRSRYRPKTIEFVDSLFNDPIEYCVEILEEIARRPWRSNFQAMGVSPKNLDEDLLKLMWRVGFRRISITPESASQSMIRNYNKGFHIDDVIHAAEAVNGMNFNTKWFFLMGGPGETNDTLQESLDFVTNHLNRSTGSGCNIVVCFVGVRIYPGTELWNIALEQGFITEHSDPLHQLWYISPELDLGRAFRRIIRAAIEYPDMFTGLDEAYFRASPVSVALGDPFGISQSYQSCLTRLARLLSLKPDDIARQFIDQLKRQGYRGSLLGKRNRLHAN